MFCLGPGHCRQTSVAIWAAATWPVPVLLQATPLDPGGSIPLGSIFSGGLQVDPSRVIHWEDQQWHYLVGWSDPANNGFGRDFYRNGHSGSLGKLVLERTPECNSSYVAVGIMEVGNWGPHTSSASMWTCMQCPQTPVLPCMLTVPNGGMVILLSGMDRSPDIIQAKLPGCYRVWAWGGSDLLPHFPLSLWRTAGVIQA